MLVTQQFPTYDTNGNLIKISECQASGLKHRIIYQEIDWLTHPGTNLNLTGGQMGFLHFSSSTDLVSFLFCFVFIWSVGFIAQELFLNIIKLWSLFVSIYLCHRDLVLPVNIRHNLSHSVPHLTCHNYKL